MATKTAEVAQEREVINIDYEPNGGDCAEIGVNGTIYQIQRGVDVEVPTAVANAWRMSKELKLRAYKENRGLQRDIEREIRNTYYR